MDDLRFTELMFASSVEPESKLLVRLKATNTTMLAKTGSVKQTLLHMVVYKGYVQATKLLLNKAPGLITAKDYEGCTAFHIAAAQGQLEVLKTLISSYKHPLENIIDNTGHTVLHAAVSRDQVKIIKFLLPKGLVNIEQKDHNGRTALSLAVLKGHKGAVKTLLDHGNIEVANKDCDDHTPLHIAILKGYEEIVKMLLLHDPNLIHMSTHNMSNLYIAVETGHSKIVKILLDKYKSLSVKMTENNNNTALHLAVAKNDHKMVEILLDGSIDLAAIRNNLGLTAFHFAVVIGNIKIIRAFLTKASAHINLKDNDGETALHFAAKKGHQEVLKILLDISPELLTVTNSAGETSLHQAAGYANIDTFKILLDKNINLIDIQDNLGRTVLHLAVMRDKPELVELILERAPSLIEVKDKVGNPAIHYVKSKEIEELMNRAQDNLTEQVLQKTLVKVETDINESQIIKENISQSSAEDNAQIEQIADGSETSLSSMDNPHLYKKNTENSEESILAPTEQEAEDLPQNTSVALTKGIENMTLSNNNSSINLISTNSNTQIANDSKKDQDPPASNILFKELISRIKDNDTASAARLIIKMKASELDAVDQEGNTALHCAIEYCNEKIVGALLRKHPTLVSIEDHCNNTSLMLAELLNFAGEHDYSQIIELLKNTTGSSLLMHDQKSYWYEYSKNAMEELLGLRLNEGISNDAEVNIKTLCPEIGRAHV